MMDTDASLGRGLAGNRQCSVGLSGRWLTASILIFAALAPVFEYRYEF